MARGTTRQLLADLEYERNRVSPVAVLRGEDGTVQVTVTPSPQSHAASGKVFRYLTIILLSATILSALLAWGVWRGFVIATLMSGWLLIAQVITSLIEIDRAGRAFVFRVARDGVSVDSAGPFGPRHWECSRDKIRDVRLFAQRFMTAEFRPMFLVFDVEREWRNRNAFALNLPARNFVVVADAIREGLGLPNRSWP
jgi:hypothetical protein